ncbi:MAG: helix-turn-helix domain-containing protein [Candidatus Rhabdochlamydia sp.]
MDFLRKQRKLKLLTLRALQDITKIRFSAIAQIEADKELLGEERAKIISETLKIDEDVITVYRGRIPQYAHKIYREKPDKLEKIIRKGVKKLEKEK